MAANGFMDFDIDEISLDVFPPKSDADTDMVLDAACVSNADGSQGSWLEAGRYDAADLAKMAVADNTIDIVLVEPGYRVRLFADAGFSGESALIEASTEALTGKIKGTVSSFVIEKI
ncbi:hypothetical protein ACFYOI_14705 [Streptomyces microflavus]|uniref:hypothetical protein n=1 Tax=Streptomyces microflavus TaxID=1919 RepID=UPI0033B5C695